MIVSTLSMMEGNGIAAYIILLALGIIFVVKGGDWFVDAASWIAEGGAHARTVCQAHKPRYDFRRKRRENVEIARQRGKSR